jgi:hypothetical protein
MRKWLPVLLVILGLTVGFACKSSTTDEQNPPTIASFTANPTTIHTGESSTLSWNVTGATSLSINQGVGTVTGATGTKVVTPTATTTYTLTATNADGTRTATCTVTVELLLPTIESFTATPTSIMKGGTSTLAWSVTDATTVSIDNGIGAVSAAGTHDVTLDDTTTYTLTATNADGDRTATATVTVLPQAVLTPTTDPSPVVWTYDDDTDTTSGTFAAVLTESNGVGGTIDDVWVGLYDASYNQMSAKNFGAGTFAANGSVSISNSTSGIGKAILMSYLAEGIDANGYPVYVPFYATITWPAGVAVVQLQRLTEPITDPRLLKIFNELKTRKR